MKLVFHSFVRVLQVLAAVTAPLVLAQAAQAETFTVTTNSDAASTDGNACNAAGVGDGCSLREAIRAANADTRTADIITFASSVRGAIELTQVGDTSSGNSAFLLAGPTEIRGPGADVLTVRRSSGGDYRIFFVGVRVAASISGLTISNGSGNGGGGIYSFGDLTLAACTVSNNVSSGFGGGIRNFGTRLVMRGCTISNNTSSMSGGGGGIDSSATLQLSNSTISGNSAPNGLGGGIRASDSTTIASCTITGNSAGGPSSAGGLSSNGATTISNTIIAGNQNNAKQPDVVRESGFISSNGYNLIGNPGSVVFDGWRDQVGTAAAPLDPQVLALALNAPGTTPTHALRISSPAFNTGNTTEASDQRGVPRPQAESDDIGAYELEESSFTNTLTVTTLVDEDDGTSDARQGSGTSLREAIAAANADGMDSVITFAVSGTIRLTRALPDLVSDGKLSITAAAASPTASPAARVAVDGGGTLRVFSTRSGANVTLAGLRITGGSGGQAGGGGVRNEGGTVSLVGCTLSSNAAAQGSGGRGGGIYANGGTVNVLRSAFVGNLSTKGGGIYVAAGTVNVDDSTFVGNAGAGIFVSGGNASVNRSTLSGNSLSGGLANQGGTLTLANTIVAGNSGSPGGDPTLPDPNIEGAFTNGGSNILTGTAAQAGLETDSDGAAISKDNGGAAPTVALVPGSPAVDTGDHTVGSRLNQYDGRGVGFSRVKRGRLDIGAFEVQNERPSTGGVFLTTPEDTNRAFTAANFTVSFSDPERDALSSIQVITLPSASSGVLQLQGTALVANQIIAASDIASLAFVPAPDFNGDASFTFIAADPFGFGRFQNAATATVQVLAVDDVPTLDKPGDVTIGEDAPQQAVSLGGITAGGGETQGIRVTATSSNTAILPDPSVTYSSAATTGTLFFALAPDANGTATITVTVTTTDSPSNSPRTDAFSQTFAVTVRPVNDAPVAVSQTVGTQEDTPLRIVLGARDIDSPDLTYEIVSGLSNGALSGTAPDLTYTPRADFDGVDSFTYRASDGQFTSDAQIVSITVAGQNDAPVAVNDAATANEDTPLDVQVLANDTDADGDALSVVRVATTSATHGAVTIASDKKSMRFVPEANFNSSSNGTASFAYTLSDGFLESTATVTITVRPVNDAPVAPGQSLAATTTAPLAITLAATDIDSPQSSLTFTVLSQPQNGTLSGSGASLRFVARRGFSGTDSFTFRASDGALDSNTATISLRVTDTNTAPAAVADAASTPFNTPITVQVLGNDSDADGDALSITALDSSGTLGTLSLSADRQSVLFTPESGFSGSTGFAYTVSDGAASSSARVTLQVQAAPAPPTLTNRAPVAGADSYTVRGPLRVLAASGVLKNDSDADGNALTALLQSRPAHGELRFQADGSFTYTPTPGYAGRDSFTYRAFDGLAQSPIVTVSLSVALGADVTPPALVLAGEGLRLERRLLPLRGNAADVYVLRGRPVVSSGLGRVTVQLRRSNGDYWSGRSYQKAPFNLPTQQEGRLFFVPASAMPPLAQTPGGRYQWTAIATDNAGNISRAQQFRVVDVAAPSLLITTPAAGRDGVARVLKLESIAGRVSEAAKVEVALRNASGAFFNGRTFASASTFLAATSTGTSWTLRWPMGLPLPVGRYSLVVRATDAAGNVSTAQRVVEVTSTVAG